MITIDECGCKTTMDKEGGTTSYEPCLACALKNAGIMLQQAGLRLDEARQEEVADQEAAYEKDQGYFGGSD